MSLEFKSDDFRVNKKLVDKIIDDDEIDTFDMVEIVDLKTHKSLVILEREDDRILFKFYYFLTKEFETLKEGFELTSEILNLASLFFGKLAWDKGSNIHVKVFKEHENIEIRLM